MKAGYNWQNGPFELMDKFGLEWFKSKLESEGYEIPELLSRAQDSFYKEVDDQLCVMDFTGSYSPVKREEGTLYLDDIKRTSNPLVTHHSASLWDIGDGVVCLEFHSQQNSMDPSILYVMNESIKLVNESAGKYKAMVIYNDAPRFSVGANLKLAEAFMNAADHPLAKAVGLAKLAETQLENILHELIYQGQSVYTALSQAPFPVIGAPKGQPQNIAFGGGNEVLMNCDAIQAGPEQVMGLPEVGVGILPAWTGSTRYLERAFKNASKGGQMVPVIQTAMALTSPMASTATSSQDAKHKLWLQDHDRISMNPDRVLSDAKKLALDMTPGYKPKPLPSFRLPGPSGRSAIRMNADKLYLRQDDPNVGVNHNDIKVVDRLATVLTGGETLERDDVRLHTDEFHDELESLIDGKPKGHLTMNSTLKINYNRMMQLERDYIMDGFRDRKTTWPRVRHTLKTNMPLREPLPEELPTPKEMRDSMVHQDLPRREVIGKPLEGDDGKRLEAMADMTEKFYAIVQRKTTAGRAKAVADTGLSVYRLSKLF
jgi:3-hydroxyacyl-CoA dehydrogenase